MASPTRASPPPEPPLGAPDAAHGTSDQKGKGKRKAADPPAADEQPKYKVKKLVPPRPFPTVSPAVSASGPRSAHHEGKNYIAITRKTQLGAYLRRCKELVLKDGYKTLHLSALGAAIPHLSTLAVSLPAILPFAADEIHVEILTGTVQVQDEIVPDDEDEDISYRIRGKSSLSVVIRIGDGVDEKEAGGSKWGPRGKRRVRGPTGQPEPRVEKEGEVDVMDES
ncbi:hypothetical protein BV25DRAFT_1806547 [Artomyces pyxidatus]|uniref:Uncharacterized protein n=1 Tax=Artomyces pyxidatus TaxID=48021 RepID=A0ACB8SWM0_9AGAM|nr:hypothetical protein BV25DRAFT_1806547 [Artomyces pyxidatus]